MKLRFLIFISLLINVKSYSQDTLMEMNPHHYMRFYIINADNRFETHFYSSELSYLGKGEVLKRRSKWIFKYDPLRFKMTYGESESKSSDTLTVLVKHFFDSTDYRPKTALINNDAFQGKPGSLLYPKHLLKPGLIPIKLNGDLIEIPISEVISDTIIVYTRDFLSRYMDGGEDVLKKRGDNFRFKDVVKFKDAVKRKPHKTKFVYEYRLLKKL